MDFVTSSFGFSEFFFAYLAASWWVSKSTEAPVHFRPIDRYGLAGARQHMALLLLTQTYKDKWRKAAAG